jgi:hypothetical protein
LFHTCTSFLPPPPHRLVKDPYGDEAALRSLLASDPRYLRGLCRLLLFDYLCLGFPAPEPCRGMVHEAAPPELMPYVRAAEAGAV